MTERIPPTEEPNYWNVDLLIGELTLWRGERYGLRLLAHEAEELYRQGPSAEIIPLRQPRGVRTNINARAYVLVPDVTATLGPATVDREGTELRPVAYTTASTWEGMKSERVGSMQAWYYHEDRTVILWECFLEDRFRKDNPLEDGNAAELWQGFEGFLIKRFPQVQTLATPSDETLYDLDHYQQFLRQLGYRPLNPKAFGKSLPARPAITL